MHCGDEWDPLFMCDHFPKSWISKEYMNHRGNVLINRDKPRKIEIYRRMIEERQNNRAKVKTTETKTRYVFPCPLNECKGFVDEKGNCPTCLKIICMKCETEKSDGHECDKELVETVQLLRKTSRPCPKCAVPIHKTDGCDQMWCTQCHTTFSYQTGNVDNGRLHNPEYYRWIRENNNGVVPREQGDQRPECGNEPHRLLRRLEVNITNKTKGRSVAKAIMRLAMEYEQQNIRANEEFGDWFLYRNPVRYTDWYPRKEEMIARKFMEIRDTCLEGVIKNDIGEESWKRELIRADKIRYRQTFIADIMDNLFIVAREMVAQFLKTKNDTVFLEHMNDLIKYTNDRIKEFKLKYKGYVPYIVESQKAMGFRYEFALRIPTVTTN
jgi:hypothetical protein